MQIVCFNLRDHCATHLSVDKEISWFFCSFLDKEKNGTFLNYHPERATWLLEIEKLTPKRRLPINSEKPAIKYNSESKVIAKRRIGRWFWSALYVSNSNPSIDDGYFSSENPVRHSSHDAIWRNLTQFDAFDACVINFYFPLFGTILRNRQPPEHEFSARLVKMNHNYCEKSFLISWIFIIRKRKFILAQYQ